MEGPFAALSMVCGAQTKAVRKLGTTEQVCGFNSLARRETGTKPIKIAFCHSLVIVPFTVGVLTELGAMPVDNTLEDQKNTTAQTLSIEFWRYSSIRLPEVYRYRSTVKPLQSQIVDACHAPSKIPLLACAVLRGDSLPTDTTRAIIILLALGVECEFGR